jgi:hypothetical protein
VYVSYPAGSSWLDGSIWHVRKSMRPGAERIASARECA